MKKTISYVIIYLVTLTVVNGATIILKFGAEQKSNLALARQLIHPEGPRIMANLSKTNQQVLGAEVDTSTVASVSAKPQTNSIVDVLYQAGEDYSFSHRSELAKGFGIHNYIGSIDQNIKLIELIQHEGVK